MSKPTNGFSAASMDIATPWIIKDWTGKVCFHGKEFPDFESAWGFIREYPEYENLSDDEFDEAMGEYFVEKKV